MKIVDIDRPITVAKAQNSSCSVPVDRRFMPKLMTITNPSGARVISQPSPLMPVPAWLISTSRA